MKQVKRRPINEKIMTQLDKYSEISSLWLEYKNGLKYYILKKVKNEELANDLSHEVLMKVYNSCCSTIQLKNVRSWLFQIAHNTTVDYFKKQQKFTNEIPETFEKDKTTIYQDTEGVLEPLIQLLPEKYAVPLQLSDIEELKQKEVAQKLNLSLTATKSRIQRARKLLKEKIIECSILEKDEQGNLLSLDLKTECNPKNSTPGKKNE